MRDRDRKYIEAESAEQAEEAAAAFFGAAARMLPGGEAPLFLFCLEEDGFDPDNADGALAVLYEKDGTYLEVYPRTGAGRALSEGESVEYIRRKRIDLLLSDEVKALLAAGRGRGKIGPPQAEKLLGEDVAVDFGERDMAASFRLLRPDEGGARFTKETLTAALAEKGVTHGINRLALEYALQKRSYGERFNVAKGRLPENGEDGGLVFHFEREKTGAPKEIGGGRVDNRALDLFEQVKKGQLLVTRVPPTEGRPGYTVRGRELSPAPGRTVPLPKMKRACTDEDKIEMRAEIDGYVEYKNDQVAVSDVYEVPGDCDMGVGNIDFCGSVKIRGTVISGMTVRAGGDIEIGGVVEGATIVAGGDITLRFGIHGADGGELRAGGNVTVQFVEQAVVTAGGDVFAGSVKHSTVEAGGSVILKGKHANAYGGRITAGVSIVAKSLGSLSHTPTEVEAGILAGAGKLLARLRQELAAAEKELEKVAQLERYLMNPRANLEDEKRRQLTASAAASKQQQTQLVEKIADEISRTEAMSKNEAARIHVFETVYPGVTVSIAKSSRRINSETAFSTFKLSGGEVVFVPCEAQRY